MLCSARNLQSASLQKMNEYTRISREKAKLDKPREEIRREAVENYDVICNLILLCTKVFGKLITPYSVWCHIIEFRIIFQRTKVLLCFFFSVCTKCCECFITLL